MRPTCDRLVDIWIIEMPQSGPTITIVEKCHGCQYLEHRMEWNHVYSDYGCVSRCDEPTIKASKGDEAIICHDTPAWCPFRVAAIIAKAEERIKTTMP